MSASSIPVGTTGKSLQTFENDLGAGPVQAEAVTPVNSAGVEILVSTAALQGAGNATLTAILAAISALSIAAAIPTRILLNQTYTMSINSQTVAGYPCTLDEGAKIVKRAGCIRMRIIG